MQRANGGGGGGGGGGGARARGGGDVSDGVGVGPVGAQLEVHSRIGAAWFALLPPLLPPPTPMAGCDRVCHNS